LELDALWLVVWITVGDIDAQVAVIEVRTVSVEGHGYYGRATWRY
jgi:hypothetical protein